MQKLIVNSATGKNIKNLSKIEKGMLNNWIELTKKKNEAFKNFNPETDMIVKKEVTDFGNQIKAMSDMAKQINEIYAVQTGIKDSTKKIDELHAIQTGKLYNPSKEKRLSKKEKLLQEVQEMRKNAHLRMLNQK